MGGRYFAKKGQMKESHEKPSKKRQETFEKRTRGVIGRGTGEADVRGWQCGQEGGKRKNRTRILRLYKKGKGKRKKYRSN